VILPTEDLSGHTFERMKLQRHGDHWLVQFAVDGVSYPAFIEPHQNLVECSTEQEFLAYLEGQALTFAQYYIDLQQGRVN
jgi:hypothetical protein